MKTDTKAKVYIVDDDAGIRKSSQLAMEAGGLVAETYASGEEFLDDYQPAWFGCVLLDLRMPDMSGIQVIEKLQAWNVSMPIIVLTGHGDVPVAVDAMKLGVFDFLEKPADYETLILKVRAALDYNAIQRQKEAGMLSLHQRFVALTARERDLLQLLISGKANKQIAAELGISIKTVANHRARVMAKTGAANAADLSRLGTIAGI
jgi:two-component system response regulator FixJ